MFTMDRKKIASYMIIGATSALVTVGAISFAMKVNNSSDGFFSPNNDGNYFKTASYTGNVPAGVPDLTVAAQKTVNAVVSIKNYSKNQPSTAQFGNGMIDPFEFFFGEPQQQQQRPQQQPKDVPSGQGSGVIISDDGYIVTNNHVIADADKIEVTLNNQKTYTAQLIGTDPNSDIALLKIGEKDLPFLNFFNSDNIKVGEWVLAVGNPFGLTSTVTAGIVSATGRSLGLNARTKSPIESYIQTDAAVNPGNSGGALVNANGDLIGINTAISSHSGTGTYEGYSFAVPSNIAKKIVEDIKKYGVVQRGYLGISGVDLTNDQMVKKYNDENKTKYTTQQGVLITELQNDGGAIDAGLKKGDIIKNVDDLQIKNFPTLLGIIGEKKPGDQVKVGVLRDGKEKYFNVKLKDLKGNTKIKTKEDLSASEKLGASFDPLTEEQKVNYGLDSGVWVKDVEPGGKLNSVGLRDDYVLMEINDKPVNNEGDINKVLKNYKGTVSVRYVDSYGRIYRRGFKLD